MKRSNKQTVPLLVLVLVALSILLYHNTITLFPAFIHSWTQSERYALALGFLNNGFDFFHPCTFNLQTISGITRVDFPINEYIVAVLMKLFGSTSPAIFRIYTLTISIIGLVYLYLLSKKTTASEIKSFVIVFFVSLSPLYVYYQAGFIPSVPAIAFIFIAYYYYFSYKENQIKKYFFISIIFFLLAALIRIPFLLFLVAVLANQFWSFIKQRKINWSEIFVFAFSFLLFGIYYRYNVHLGRMYGSMFLDSFLPAKNMQDFKDVLSQIYNVWLFQYFTKAHYPLLLIGGGFTLCSFFFSKENLKKYRPYWFHLLIVFCGAGLYFILMLKQFYDHDYYFLDSLFVPVILFFVLSIVSIKIETNKQKLLWGIFFSATIVWAFINCFNNQTERYTTFLWDRVETSRQNFIGTDKYLDSIGISKDAKILVIDAYSTNIPLILMNRKGYTVYQTSRDDAFMPLVNYKWDYVAIQDVFLVSDVMKYFPVVTAMLEKIGGNGKVSFYKRSATMKGKSLKEFLKITPENTVYSTNVCFDTLIKEEHIKSTENTSGKKFYTYPNSGLLSPTFEYGTSLSFSGKELQPYHNLKVLVTGYIYNESPIDELQLIASISDPKETYYYQSHDMKLQIKQTNKWQKFELQFVLPENILAGTNFGVYLWNKKKETVYYDNLEFVVYK